MCYDAGSTVNRSETVGLSLHFQFRVYFRSGQYTIIDFNSTVTVVEDKTEEDDGFAVSTTLVAAGVLVNYLGISADDYSKNHASEPINTSQLTVEQEIMS